MLKSETEIQKKFIKNLIKTELKNSEVLIELRKGKFKPINKKKDLNPYHYKNSEKDYIIVKSAFYIYEMKNFLKNLYFFKHKFVPEQEKFDFTKSKENLKFFFKDNKINYLTIPDIKCDFITKNNTYTFDLTKKEFYIKKDSQDKKNTNIMYKKNQFRLVIAQREENVIQKNFNILNFEKIEFLRIKFKNEFSINFMNFNFFDILSSKNKLDFKNVLDFCINCLKEEISNQKNTFNKFKKLIENLKMNFSHQIECQLNSEFVIDHFDNFENIIDIYFYNFFQFYEKVQNFELISTKKNQDNENNYDNSNDYDIDDENNEEYYYVRKELGNLNLK